MAALSGKSGIVHYGGVPVLRINNWTVNTNTNMRDHTSFTTGTLQWRSIAPGLSGGNGTFAGFWDAQGSTAQNDCVDAALAASTGEIILYADKTGGDNLRGSIYFSGLTAGAAVDGDVTVSYPFTFNGAVNYSTAT
jgi:hypothetical protein